MKVSIDTKERISSLVGFSVECFKIFMACLLSLFVPQKCGNDMCSIKENFIDLDPYNIFVLVINFATLAIFFSLYVIELDREYWMIKYLDINRQKGEVSISKETYPEIAKNLTTQNKRYYDVTLSVLVLFFVNIISSMVLVFGFYYYDYRTITTLLSNTLLLVGKVKSCLTISKKSHMQNLAISYYTIDHLCYNDIDDDYKKEIKLDDVSLNLPG
jgi:hypothetical protein